MTQGRFTLTFSLFLTLAALAISAPGCDIISATEDCQAACEQINTCGIASLPDCTAYCAAMVSATAQASCTTAFSEQNECVAKQETCDTVESGCRDKLDAFNACMVTYCLENPDATGCDQVQ